MCNLESEPWRANFTGGPCRCGVPMPGNDEERAIDVHHKKMQYNTHRESKSLRERVDNLRNKYGIIIW